MVGEPGMERAAKRRRFLVELYRQSDADPLAMVAIEALASAIGMDEDEADRVAGELAQVGMVATPETGPNLEIAMGGIAEVEQLVSADTGDPLDDVVLERRQQRVTLLGHVYRASGADINRPVSDFSSVSLPRAQLWAMLTYLEWRGFVQVHGHSVLLTGQGVRAVEESGADAGLRL
jgi:hypothetical protein